MRAAAFRAKKHPTIVQVFDAGTTDLMPGFGLTEVPDKRMYRYTFDQLAKTMQRFTEVLGLARSNVSTGLKELQSYGIVRRVHIEGDRRDHFVAETDLWEVLMRLAEERKKRELDPTIRLLGELSDSIKARGEVPPHVRERIGRMHEFIGTLTGWYADVRHLPKPTLVRLMKLGRGIARFLPGLGGGGDSRLRADRRV